MAFLEHTLRDVLFAVRAFARAPLVAVTIVVTVAIGLGLMAVLFSVLNLMLFRVDDVPDIHEMFAVERPRRGEGERQRFTRPQFEALQQDTRVFSGMAAELADVDLRIDGRMMAGSIVSGDFFQVLGVHAARGRTLLPSDDERGGGQPVMVLSDRGWRRHFSGDPQIVGRRLIVNGAPHEIVGVMPAGFRGLSVTAPDYWAPLAMLAEHLPVQRGREDQAGLDIVGRLRPGTSPASAAAQLAAWDAQQPGRPPADGRAATITLVPRRGTVPQPMEALVVSTPLFIAFGLILLIGCANVANLLLARAVTQQKDMGVRLSLGASRARVVRQLLTESLLLALAASALGFVLARAALDVAVRTIVSSLPPDAGDVTLMVPGGDWRVALFLVASAIVATALFGLMPALQATRVDPVRSLRGGTMGDGRPRRSRNVLIGLQVSASVLLLICAAVFLRSAWASATVDPGFRTEDTVLIDLVNEPTRQAMVQAVTVEPAVTQVASVWPTMAARPRGAVARSPGVTARVAYRFVSPEYFEVLDIPILSGRAFTGAERAGNVPVVIISDSLARTLWPGRDPVGQSLQLEADPDSPARRADELQLPARIVTVVGVSRHVEGIRLGDFREANVYVPASVNTAGTALVARVLGDPDLVRQALLDRLTRIDPNMGQILTMRTMARLEAMLLRIAFWATFVLGAIALVLTVSGLFSVLSYLVEQRRREIGVRMALGASAGHVTRLVLAQTSRPVIVGLATGTALAAGLATLLLAIPGAGAIGQVIHVLDPMAYVISLMVVVAACGLAASLPVIRAVGVEPMKMLRQQS